MTIKVGDTVQFVNDENQMLDGQQWIVGSIEVEDGLVTIKSDDGNNLCSIPLFDTDSADKYLKKIN